MYNILFEVTLRKLETTAVSSVRLYLMGAGMIAPLRSRTQALRRAASNRYR